jgi:hypothetical protein
MVGVSPLGKILANPHVAKKNLVFLLKAIDPWSSSSFRRVICHQLVTTPYPHPSYPFLGTLIHLMHCIVQKLPGRRLPPDFECIPYTQLT